MPNVFSVANYVLQKAGPMTTMKLQKLVYYCQAYSLAWDGIPLFEEDFEAWANGPVCRKLFASHRGTFSLEKDAYSKYEASFSPEQIDTMDAILDAYVDKSSQWLVTLSHKEQPWIDAREGLPPGVSSQNIIQKEKMQVFYGGFSVEDK